MNESPNPEDKQTDLDKAVDDIVAHESDQVLESQDEQVAEAKAEAEARAPGRIKRFFKAWLGTSKGRWMTFILVMAAVITVGAVPNSRYAVLNAAGVRASMSISVTDKSTLQPLAGITVEIQDNSTKTDDGGTARLANLRLGPSELVIKKPGFATHSQKITIGWGSNPLDEVQLNPTGSRYAFRVTDFLSGKGVTGAQAVSGEASATADSQGLVVLTLEEPDDALEIVITVEGYRSQQFEIDAEDTEERRVVMVPARWHAFLSNRTGTLDLYKVSVDGRNDKLVLKGTGSERSDTVLLAHPAEDVVALASRRSGEVGAGGLALNVLTIIDLETGAAQTLSTSGYIQLLGWSGKRLVYVAEDANANDDDPKRQKLMSYDFQSKNNREIGSANSFNAAVLAAGDVYYAPASAHQNGINVSLFRASPDGSSSAVVLASEVNNLVRTSYDQMSILSDEKWYDYRLGSSQPSPGNQPTTLAARHYVDNAVGLFSLWSHIENGQPALLAHDVKANQDRVLVKGIGIGYPVSWLSDSAAVYRVNTDQETADYAISLDGGEPHKITNVTSVGH